MITTVKQLKAENIVGHSVYKLSAPFTVFVDNEPNEWSTDEFFSYDGKVLRAGADGSLINPSILFKAKVYLLTIKEWAK